MSFWKGFEKRASYITKALQRVKLNTPDVRKRIADKIKSVRAIKRSGKGDPIFEKLWEKRRKHLRKYDDASRRKADKVTKQMTKLYPPSFDEHHESGWDHASARTPGKGRFFGEGVFDTKIEAKGLPTRIYPNGRNSFGNPKAAYKAFKKGKGGK